MKKGDWTPEEDKVIQEGVAELGTKWSEIVKRLPGRTDNSIKNRYNSQLRREQRRARAQSNGATKSAETPEGGGGKPAEEADGPNENTPAEAASAEGEPPSAKRMRLETEATLAAAAAAVSAYAGSSTAEGDTPADEAPPLVPADPD